MKPGFYWARRKRPIGSLSTDGWLPVEVEHRPWSSMQPLVVWSLGSDCYSLPEDFEFGPEITSSLRPPEG